MASWPVDARTGAKPAGTARSASASNSAVARIAERIAMSEQGKAIAAGRIA
jgi:hypothetical protein